MQSSVEEGKWIEWAPKKGFWVKIHFLWDLFVPLQGLRPSSADLYHDQMQMQKINEEHLKMHQQDTSRKNEMKEQVKKIFFLVA